MHEEHKKIKWEELYYFHNTDVLRCLKKELARFKLTTELTVESLKHIENQALDDYFELERYVLETLGLHDQFKKALDRKPISWNWWMPARLRLCRLIQVLADHEGSR